MIALPKHDKQRPETDKKLKGWAGRVKDGPECEGEFAWPESDPGQRQKSDKETSGRAQQARSKTQQPATHQRTPNSNGRLTAPTD